MVEITKKVCAQYLKDFLRFKKALSAIYVYGSVTTKKEANDVDVMIIVDDSLQEPKQELMIVLSKLSEIVARKGKENNIEFHFQPIKLLSKWWYLLLEGEPWIVSSLSDPWIIYEKKGIITEASYLVKEAKNYSKQEKAERLMERSEMYIQKSRELLLNSIHHLSEAGTEAAQILLLFDNKLILNKKKIVEELERNYIKVIGADIIGNYKEIVDLEEKMEAGFLSEFTAENLDYYLDKIKKFIEKTESMLSKS